jgi:HEAT repeat protein
MLAALALVSGCAGRVMDTITKKDFQLSDLFVQREPVEVLKKSDDGGERADALRRLPEPGERASKEERDNYVQLMTTTAMAQAEPPLCRLAAIRRLGQCKDPRAVDALRTVFLQNLPYSSDMNSLVRQNTLTALGETRQPAALELLIRVAKEPPAAGDEKAQQETLDRRLAAIRGLGKFNHPDALETLLYVLRTDQDVAVGQVTGASLTAATGKDLPPDPQAWDRELHASRPTPLPATQQPIQQIQRREPQPGQPVSSSTTFQRVSGSIGP